LIKLLLLLDQKKAFQKGKMLSMEVCTGLRPRPTVSDNKFLILVYSEKFLIIILEGLVVGKEFLTM
jgi:hypothetical protein